MVVTSIRDLLQFGVQKIDYCELSLNSSNLWVRLAIRKSSKICQSLLQGSSGLQRLHLV